MCENSLLILSGNSEIIRNGDVYYPFRQNSDFLLLTGLNIPCLTLIGIKKSDQTEWIIYSDPISDHEKIWGTGRIEHTEIAEKSGITHSRPMKDMKKDLQEFSRNAEYIYTRDGTRSPLKKESKRGVLLPKEKILSLDPLLVSLRMIKIPEEIEKMREAIRVTRVAHDLVRESLRA
jgi:Xaa-Pro aminopeptidase